MRKKRTLLVASALLFALSKPSLALIIVYGAPFAPEGVGATGSGTALLTVDTDTREIRFQATFSGLSGLTTAAHVHCCTASPGTGNAGVATQLPSFAGFPLNVSSGSFDATLDMDLAASWNPAFVSANGATEAAAFNALVAGLNDNRAYFNIHTTTFGGGEIRARTVVPEPATSGLVLLGLGMLGAASRRRAARA